MTKIEEYLASNDLSKWLVDNEQGRIDLKILPYLKDIENGFFVEAGALDGLFMSNTKLLEDLGWTGLLVEPQRKAVQGCADNRPNSKVVWSALVSDEYKEETIGGDFFFDGEGGDGAWASVDRGSYGAKTKKIVPALRLSTILDALKITRVDFFSLDVEGYELEVLKGTDFNKVDFGYILIEVNLTSYSLEDMDKFLAERGFKNLGCLSNFSEETNEGWDGSHNDYLYGR